MDKEFDNLVEEIENAIRAAEEKGDTKLVEELEWELKTLCGNY